MTRPTVIHGDMLEELPRLAAEGVQFSACGTDPPYHFGSIVKRFSKSGGADRPESKVGAFNRHARGFMGKTWDAGDIAFRPETWAAVGSVLRPGAHLVAFAAPKGGHRMVCAIEDAGFEIRDDITEFVASDTYINRFLASLSEEQINAFIRALEDSPLGGILGRLFWVFGSGFPKSHDTAMAFDKALLGFDERDDAKDWEMSRSHFAAIYEGWGTGLKPAYEPIVLARWPLSEKNIKDNVVLHGTGAINIDGCRVRGFVPKPGNINPTTVSGSQGIYGLDKRAMRQAEWEPSTEGRFPANVILDGSDEVANAFPAAPGALRPVLGTEAKTRNVYDQFAANAASTPRGDEGSAARFFYSGKADAADRLASKHPTVKPVDPMRWLVRLITPPGGRLLDPFAGSGTTGMACMAEGIACTMIEREAEYVADIRRRIAHVRGEDAPLFKGAAE